MRINFLFILVFLSTQLFCQKNEAYFQKIIDTTNNKRLKLAALDSLIYDYANQKDIEVFASRLEQYTDLAIELEEYDNAIEFTLRGFYNINHNLNQKKRADSLLNKVGKYLDKVKDPYLIGGFYSKKGAVYSSTKEYNKAIENYTKAIESYSDKDSAYKADAIYFRGNQKFFNGKYLKAIEDYQTASKYYKELGDLEYYFYTQGSIISVYGVNGFDKKTIEERKKIIRKKTENNFTSRLYTEYYNQSLNYKNLDSIKQQEASLLKAYELVKEQKKNALTYQKIIIFSTISSFYSINNNLTKAKKYLDEARIEFLKQDKKSNPSAEFLRANARYLFKKKRYKEAIQSAEESFDIAKDNGLATSMMHSSELLSNIYTSIGENKKAYTYHKKYSKIKDSIFSVTKTNALSYYQTLYETEKKEKEIVTQKNEIYLLEEKQKEKNRFIAFLSIASLLGLLTLYFYWQKRDLRRKNILQEDYSQKLLLSQEDERKRISKDLHDSLGQSLLLIKNKVTLKKDNKTESLVNNAIEEMRNISRDLHPFHLEHTGITKTIQNLINQLNENYKDILIFGDIENFDNKLDKKKEINIFRIIQECLNNIIKHADAKSAKVDVVINSEKLYLTIKDNGLGFDFSEKFNDFKSLGLKTIKERVRFLNGSIKVESNFNSGTTFSIVLPLQ